MSSLLLTVYIMVLIFNTKVIMITLKNTWEVQKSFFSFFSKTKRCDYEGVHEGYITGLYDKNFKCPFNLHTSPLFVVPKPKLNEWRTVWHGSWKDEQCFSSLNELINDEDKSVRYITTQEIAKMVLTAIGDREFAFLHALDAHHAYYSIPLHPSQYKYMGMQRFNKIWVFQSLQMRLGSACRTYTRFADAIEFVIVKENVDIMFIDGVQMMGHYLNDFLGAQPTLERAVIAYNSSIDTFDILNVPTSPKKRKPPPNFAKIFRPLL